LLPSGKTFRVKHIHRFRLRDGKIVEHIAVRDDLGMFQQLGHLGALAGQPYSLEMLDLRFNLQVDHGTHLMSGKNSCGLLGS